MNGAIAEPLVSTTRPPNTTIMIRIGSSQNFFRTRMKRQSSDRKSITFPWSSLSATNAKRLRKGANRLARSAGWLGDDAIHGDAATKKAGLLRYARNDGGWFLTHTRIGLSSSRA